MFKELKRLGVERHIVPVFMIYRELQTTLIYFSNTQVTDHDLWYKYDASNKINNSKCIYCSYTTDKVLGILNHDSLIPRNRITMVSVRVFEIVSFLFARFGFSRVIHLKYSVLNYSS